MKDIEVDINTDVNDMRIWALWRLFHSRTYYIYILAIFCLCIILISTEFGRNDYISVIFVAIFVGILPIVACMGIVRQAWQRIKNQNKRMLRFENEGVRIMNDRVEVLYKWSECKIVTETKNYLFSENSAGGPLFALCKSRLDSNTVDEIRDYLSYKGKIRKI